MSTEYRVQLDIFSGPLDLLLFLLKRDELDIQDIPIVRITDQYVAYVRLLENLDPNTAGDFLVMASTLIEMKSRALLPTPPLEGDNEEEDARLALVKQLLEYKRFKDAARSLGTSADDRSKRFTRQPTDLPAELRGVELEEVEVWDLLSAFGRVMTAIGRGPGVHEVRYDDTPLETYVEEISAALLAKSAIPFHALFEDRTSRAEIVGLFLALLELIRRRRVRAEQEKSFGVIYLFAIEEVDQPPEDPPQVATADAATLLPPTAPSGLDDEWSAAGEFPPIEPDAARDTHEEREPADEQAE